MRPAFVGHRRWAPPTERPQGWRRRIFAKAPATNSDTWPVRDANKASITFAAFSRCLSTSSRSTNVQRILLRARQLRWKKFRPSVLMRSKTGLSTSRSLGSQCRVIGDKRDAVLLTPASSPVELSELALLPCHNHSDHTATFLDITDQVLDVALPGIPPCPCCQRECTGSIGVVLGSWESQGEFFESEGASR